MGILLFYAVRKGPQFRISSLFNKFKNITLFMIGLIFKLFNIDKY